MELYGKKYTTRDLRKRIGSADQVAGIRLVQLDDGKARPARAALFHTGSGLEFTVLIDRGMDIAAASFAGKAMGWRSKVGDVAPQYYEAEGIRWLRSFQGGLMNTCGLTVAGAPVGDSALDGTGLHGRIGHTPAANLQVVQEWQGNDYVLSVTGTMRETAVFGENLTLTRTVSTKLGAKRFWVKDVVANEGFDAQKFMLLYHCNVGWPAVDKGSKVLTPSKFVAPRDAEAEKGQEQWHSLDAPTHGYAEKAYYHEMQPERDGFVTTAIVNDGFGSGSKGGEGFGVYVKYKKDTLPRFTQWKQMGEQDYVVGLEPCNCGVEGRDQDAQRGLLHSLRAGETREHHLEFGAITEEKEVKAIESQHKKTKPKLVASQQDFVQKPK